jgi:hypothetical protein
MLNGSQPNRLTVTASPSIRSWWSGSSWKIRWCAFSLHMFGLEQCELGASTGPHGEGQDLEGTFNIKFHPGCDLGGQFNFVDSSAKRRGHAPQVGGVFLAAGKDRTAVGTEGDEPDLALVTEAGADRPTGRPVALSQSCALRS